MTTVLAPQLDVALYPPTVVPPPRPLPLLQFLFRFVRNPLLSLPRPIYEEPILVRDNGYGRGAVAWVTGPALIEKVLQQASAQFPKAPLEKRVFHRTLGDAILQAADLALATISWDIAAEVVRLPEWMWYPGKLRRRRAARVLRGAVSAILARRRAAGLQGGDLLARLARAQDPETGAPMSEDQLVDNLLTFLAA